MSDIDDTLMCSGGHWPAGCDRRYPRKCIYPGVLAFFKELDTRQALRVQVGKLARLSMRSELRVESDTRATVPLSPRSSVT